MPTVQAYDLIFCCHVDLLSHVGLRKAPWRSAIHLYGDPCRDIFLVTADRGSSRGRKTWVGSFTCRPRFARSSARWASACEPGYHFRRFALSSRCTTTRRVILVADQPRVVVRSALWRRTDMALPHSKLWQETVHILHLAYKVFRFFSKGADLSKFTHRNFLVLLFHHSLSKL